jgi:hypothetical protein
VGRRDRVEARLHRLERLDQRLGMRPDRGELLQRAEHVDERRISVRIFAARERARFFTHLASGHVGEKLVKRIGSGPEGNILVQDLPQGAIAHRRRVCGAEHGNNLIDETEIVLGKDAEGVADFIVDAAVAQVEIDVPGFLL